MHTISSHSETRAVSIAAPPERVLAYVGDAQNLPSWAPRFASAVRADGDHWAIQSGDAELKIAVSVSHEHGTVDLLAAADRRLGAFSRVIPNGEGCEYLFTLLFPEGTPTATIADQMKVVEDELGTVRSECERLGR
jgi:hypothetical protein